MLADFDSRLSDDGAYKMYASFKKKYEDLVVSLRESEGRMGLLYRTNGRTEYVRKERDTYDDLLSKLEEVKAEYDSWLKTVQ